MDEETTTMPMPYHHSVLVYKRLDEEAIEEAVKVEDDLDPASRRIWTGHLTGVFRELQLATPTYTSVMNNLKRMGCVLQIQRGGGNAPSKWELIQAPTEELWLSQTAPKPRKQAQQLDQVSQQVRDMNNRLLKVEAALGIR